MNIPETTHPERQRYARCIDASKKVRWSIDADIIRNRTFDTGREFLPDGLSRVSNCERSLSAADRRFLTQVQGRTYANMFGLVERYINAKIIETQEHYALGDQVALEALVRFSDEELKHQELFRRLDAMAAAVMPEGYAFVADPNEVAEAVLSHSSWSVLALTLVIELFTQAHYRESIASNVEICPLFKDVFHFHWMEESQHAILDELEWRREDARISAAERDRAVDDLIGLVVAVDHILQQQAAHDASYFVARAEGGYVEADVEAFERLFLGAYRWQYILSGTSLERFQKVLGSLITPAQGERIQQALATLSPEATPHAA